MDVLLGLAGAQKASTRRSLFKGSFTGRLVTRSLSERNLLRRKRCLVSKHEFEGTTSYLCPRVLRAARILVALFASGWCLLVHTMANLLKQGAEAYGR